MPVGLQWSTSFSKTTNNNKDLQERLEDSPRKSTRRLPQELGMSRWSLLRIINDDLKLIFAKFKSYKDKLMTLRQNDLRYVRMWVLQATQAGWVWFSSVIKLKILTWISGICGIGLKLSPISIPIAHSAKRKWLWGVAYVQMASWDHTFEDENENRRSSWSGFSPESCLNDTNTAWTSTTNGGRNFSQFC